MGDPVTSGLLLGAGAAVSIFGMEEAADAAEAEGKRTKKQYAIAAKQAKANATVRSIEERRKARLVESSAIARAAASGAGTEGSAQDIVDEIAGEGEYRAALALYEGAEDARSLRATGSAALRTARNEARSLRTQAVATVFSTGGQIVGYG